MIQMMDVILPIFFHGRSRTANSNILPWTKPNSKGETIFGHFPVEHRKRCRAHGREGAVGNTVAQKTKIK
jgi:hypothetical protein